MNEKSVWRDASLPSFPALEGDAKTDVLIIGGGIAGLLCARALTEAGVDCLLVERERICRGVTGGTTAKITSQHGLIYDKLIRRFGVERARMYLEANERALARYRALCAGIDCGFEEKDSFVYSTDDRAALERELRALERLGYRAELVENLPLPFETEGAVKFPRQAQFHPLAFLAEISRGLNIREETTVREFDGRRFLTDRGRIEAKRTVVATHFPLFNKHGSYFLKLYQHRSYVLALEGAAQPDGMYLDEKTDGLSFRNHGNLLLLGGGSHRTGRSGGGWAELDTVAQRYYPAAKQTARWAAQDCMSLDGVPYIGRYSSRTPSLYVATGFNKWGMTSAMVAATLLTDLLLGRDNPCEALFSPSRSMLRPQLALNAAGAVAHIVTPTTPRCPHLGCALKWNAQEHSWDCPCHGSRFSRDGKLLDNPATGDLKHRPHS